MSLPATSRRSALQQAQNMKGRRASYPSNQPQPQADGVRSISQPGLQLQRVHGPVDRTQKERTNKSYRQHRQLRFSGGKREPPTSRLMVRATLTSYKLPSLLRRNFINIQWARPCTRSTGQRSRALSSGFVSAAPALLAKALRLKHCSESICCEYRSSIPQTPS